MEDRLWNKGDPAAAGPPTCALSTPGSVTLRPLSWPLGTPKGPESGEGQSHTSASKVQPITIHDDEGADSEKEEGVGDMDKAFPQELQPSPFTHTPVSLSHDLTKGCSPYLSRWRNGGRAVHSLPEGHTAAEPRRC